MRQRRALSRLAGPMVLAGLLLCARLVSAPALYDPVAAAAPASAYLKIPATYLVLAPLFTLWDGVSMLSMSRLIGFLVGLLLLHLVWRVIAAVRRHRSRRTTASWWSHILRETAYLAAAIAVLLGFVVIGAVWHRPMLSLAGTDPHDVVVDFHSHTNVSHDVRDTWMRGFDLEANRRWHSRAGFHAAFVTDHNTVAALAGDEAGHQRPAGSKRQAAICPGIEVSVWRAHIVLLGDTGPVDRSRYKSFDGLLALLAASDSAYGALSVASLPEYRRNHWGRLDQLASAGLDGFEIVNASPRANELTREETDTVIATAKAHNKFVVGVSDSHGWGATSMVWNLVGVSDGSAGNPCPAVLGQLRAGFPAVRIVERHRLRPDDWWPMWLTPLGVMWETWRSMGWTLTVAWLVWIGLWAIRRRRKTRSHARPPLAGS